MDIVNTSIAGSLESSDLQVSIEPLENGIIIEINSGVFRQYGRRIKEVVLETLSRLDIKAAKVTIVDRGALDCTVRARVECAVLRSAGCSDKVPWGGAVRE